MAEDRLFHCLARELLTQLEEQVVSDAKLQRVLQRCSAGTIRHRPGEYQQLLRVTELLLGLATTHLSSQDLICAWFMLRQEFANLCEGKVICRVRLKWLRDSVLEQVQS